MSVSFQFFNFIAFFLVALLSYFEPEEILKHRLVLCGIFFFFTEVGVFISHGFIGNPDSCFKSLSLTDNYILTEVSSGSSVERPISGFFSPFSVFQPWIIQ